MLGELSQRQIAEQIAEENQVSLDEAKGVALVSRLAATMKKVLADVENEVKKYKTGKLARSYEDPEKALMTNQEHLPGVLQPLMRMLRRLKMDGVPIRMESITEAFDSDQEQVLKDIVLVAVNEGDFYRKGKDAKGAVKYAAKGMLKSKMQDLEYDLKIIEKAAVKEVARQWKQK